MNYWKVIFATAVIFGAGVLTGGLLVNYVQHYDEAPLAKVVKVKEKPPRTVANAKPHLPTSLSKQFLEKLDEALKLSPEQRTSICKIIGEGQGQICKVIRDSRMEIRKELTPDQRKEFDELIKSRVHRTVYSNTNTTENASAATNGSGPNTGK